MLIIIEKKDIPLAIKKRKAKIIATPFIKFNYKHVLKIQWILRVAIFSLSSLKPCVIGKT